MMKKTTTTLLFLLLATLAFSQAVVQRAGTSNTVQDARIWPRYNFFLPRFSDTTAANSQKGIDSCGAVISTYDNKLWVRNCNPKQWVVIGSGSNISFDTLSTNPLTDVFLKANTDSVFQVLVSGDTTYTGIQLNLPDGLVSGGVVTWVSGLTYDVSPAFYYINKLPYTFDGGRVTLDAADPTHPRIDVIALTTSQDVVAIKGTAAVSPLEPQVGSTQLALTSVQVNAGATTPASSITITTIYDEDLGQPTEYNVTASTGGLISANPGGTSEYFNGSIAIKVDSFNNNGYLSFKTLTTQSAGTYSTTKLWLKLTAPMTSTQNIMVQLLYQGRRTTYPISLRMVKTAYNAWQNVAVNMSLFTFLQNQFDEVRLLFVTNGTTCTNPLYIDGMEFQVGIVNAAPTPEKDPTIPWHVKSITTTNIANWNTGYNKSVGTFAKNATRDSIILTLTDGTRFAVKDSSGGTSFDSTGLSNRINAKENGITAPYTTRKYWTGYKTFGNFGDTTRATPLTGLSTSTATAITASDDILTAAGKLQAQITAHQTNTSNPHTVTLQQATTAGNVTTDSIRLNAGYAAGMTALRIQASTPLEMHTQSASGIEAYSHSGTGFRAFTQNFYRSRGTQGAETATVADKLGEINFFGHNGTTYTQGAGITVSAEGNFTTSSATTMNMFVNGTSNTTAVNLSSAGVSIRCATAGTSVGTVTAQLQIAPQTTVAGTAPIKLVSGTKMTTPEAGAIEYDGTDFTFTNATARYIGAKQNAALTTGQIPFTGAGAALSGNANLFYDSTNARLQVGGSTYSYAAPVQSTSSVSGPGGFNTAFVARGAAPGFVFEDTNGDDVFMGNDAGVLYLKGGATATTGIAAINTTGSNFGSNTIATSTLQSSGSFATAYVAKTANYTATISDHTIDCTSGTFTVTLPTAVGITGRTYTIVNSGAGTITVGTTSSQTFTNVSGTPTTLSMATVGTKNVQSTGAAWVVISSF